MMSIGLLAKRGESGSQGPFWILNKKSSLRDILNVVYIRLLRLHDRIISLLPELCSVLTLGILSIGHGGLITLSPFPYKDRDLCWLWLYYYLLYRSVPTGDIKGYCINSFFCPCKVPGACMQPVLKKFFNYVLRQWKNIFLGKYWIHFHFNTSLLVLICATVAPQCFVLKRIYDLEPNLSKFKVNLYLLELVELPWCKSTRLILEGLQQVWDRIPNYWWLFFGMCPIFIILGTVIPLCTQKWFEYYTNRPEYTRKGWLEVEICVSKISSTISYWS